MRLVHPFLENQMMLDIQKPCEWIIESPTLFSRYVQELQIQIEGGEGAFVLSRDNEELHLSKLAEIIFNPFSVNINDKKILNKLYTELSNIAYEENMYLSTQKVLADLRQYATDLEYQSNYILDISGEMDLISLWKALAIKLESFADDYFENIIQYMKIQSELMGKRLMVFVNARSYFEDKQIEQLIQNGLYNEMTLLFVENSQKDFSDAVIRYIIDKDGCEIF